ncbi:protein of unknown function [Thauera humireducens]|nr:protein of unknown function [Thauera humireducens]
MAGRESIRGVQPQDPGQYRSGDVGREAAVAGSSEQRTGYSRPAQRPTYGQKGKPGSVTVVATHFSKAPRSALSGAQFGTGHTSAEAERVREGDAEIRSRLNFYVDEGNGVLGEVGTGAHAHEVELSNIYDIERDSEGLWTSADANANELALVKAGYDGDYRRGAFVVGGKPQRGVVLLGKRHSGVPVAYAGQPEGRTRSAKAQPRPEPRRVTRARPTGRLPLG